MTGQTYALLENYMCACMDDSAHDREHVYRVLYNALRIAKTEQNVDYDVLIAACLLHDIGRREQFADPAVCHARAGSEKAYRFLTEQGFGVEFAEQVRHCILTHRFRKALPPQSVEAKILFDADKLDVTGAIGIARTLMYKADVSEPLYHVLSDGSVSDGTLEESPSFFREYHFKLKGLYVKFYTAEGARLAAGRRAIARVFCENLYREVSAGRREGREMLQQLLRQEEAEADTP